MLWQPGGKVFNIVQVEPLHAQVCIMQVFSCPFWPLFGNIAFRLPGTKLWHPGAHCLPGVQLCASLCRCFLARPPPCPLPRCALSRRFLVTSSWNSDAVLQGATGWCPAQVCIIVQVFSSWTPSWNSTLLITASSCCCVHTLVHFLFFAYCRTTSWRHTLLCWLHPLDHYRGSVLFANTSVPIWLSSVSSALYFWLFFWQ